MEGIGRVLIVSGNEKGAEFIENMLCQFEPETTVTLHAGSEARRVLLDGCAFDYIFINMPLPDETGADLARRAAESSSVMVLVKNDVAEQVGYSLAESGIFILPKPISNSNFVCGIYMMMAAKARADGYIRKNEELQLKINENNLIFRAKCLLIEKKSLSEHEAHKYIEKRAMDTRKSKCEIANDIIRTYDED